MKKLVILLSVALAASIAALAVALFMPAESSQAAVEMAPVSVEVEVIEAVAPLEIDPETGLPKGAQMFQAGDHICLAVPGFDIECWCPCETGSCAEVDTAVEATEVVTDTVQQPEEIPTGDDDDGEPGRPPDRPDDDPQPEPTPEPTPEPEPGDEPDDDPEPTPEPEPGDEPDDEPDDGDEPPAEDPPADDDDDDDKGKKDKGNNGHGNNDDGMDSSNPGKKPEEDESDPVDDEGHGGGRNDNNNGNGRDNGKGKGH